MSQDLLDLYHFTSAQAARAIVDGGAWRSAENTGEVYASDRKDGQATGYGPVVVHVVILAACAQLDDEFPDGERHYRFRPADALVIGILT
jgi:hypothetical protein